ncbi:hypothetical protein EV702DRAFT_1208104 [Suillus placidus]|uniref:C2H2-type domain-containing protein n=1 Tax=Suillus placidus TaxID=48579 RepID=A0A9P7CVF9_9AGAM|nr:hypothetical protein EV702DRAFT_1208104 [Suillus placidus]
MVVDPGLGALCCHICQVALTPDHVSGHIENKHPTIKLDSKQYSEAVDDMKVPMTLPTSIAGGRDCSAYKGLLVQDGIACDSCSYACGSKATMGNHHRAEHRSIPTPMQWSPCKMQQLNKGAHSRFWRVAEVEEMPDDYQKALDRMRKEMAEVTRVEQVPQDKRMVSPWLLTTKWHEHVAGHDIMTLRKLVQIPKADDPIMPPQELILQRLNSPDPSKDGINNSPLHRHQEDATMKSYIRTHWSPSHAAEDGQRR